MHGCQVTDADAELAEYRYKLLGLRPLLGGTQHQQTFVAQLLNHFGQHVGCGAAEHDLERQGVVSKSVSHGVVSRVLLLGRVAGVGTGLSTNSTPNSWRAVV